MSETVSCTTCPSYVPPDKVKQLVGVTYGNRVPYCSTRGIPLGVNHQSASALSEVAFQFAETCVSYGEPAGKPKQMVGRVATTPVFIQAISPASRTAIDDLESPDNCRSCVYYSDASSVRSQFGWPVAMCRASGDLLPTRMHSRIAPKCEVGLRTEQTLTTPRSTVSDSRKKKLDTIPDLKEIIPIDIPRSERSWSNLLEDERFRVLRDQVFNSVRSEIKHDS